MDQKELHEQKTVSRVSLFHVIVIFTIKLSTALFLTNSLSFLTELTDSILDFLAVAITFVALIESRKPADFKHMYGHYKVNSVAGLLQAMLIIGMYCLIFYQAFTNLFFNWETYEVQNGSSGGFVLLVILGIVYIDSSIIVKIGKKHNNQLIIAQGMNFRGDFYRNISFIIGLFISSIGGYWDLLDLGLAIVFSLISIRNGLKVFRESFNELIDANTVSQDAIDDIEKHIAQLPEIEKVESITVRTAGNTLDAQIAITLDKEASAFGANELSHHIKEMFQHKFDEFTCNVLVQIDTGPPVDKQNIEYLFHIIREIGSQDKDISNVHNITLDVYADKILVQCHLDVNPTITVEHAHNHASELEKRITEQIKKIYTKTENVQVVTHIEPAGLVKKAHSHKMTGHASEDLRKFAIEIVMAEKAIKKIRELTILQEDNGIYITLIVQMEKGMNIEEAHIITENLEYELLGKIPNIKRCIIHSEPFLI